MLPPLARLPLLAAGEVDAFRVVWPANRERVDPSRWRRPRRIPIPRSDTCIDLEVKPSTIALQQPGLFAVNDIPAGSLVSVYTWDAIVSEADLKGRENEKEARRYAVESPDPAKTLVIHTPIDKVKHPAAIANEPKEGTQANMQMQAADVELGPTMVTYQILALYTCKFVAAGEELTWHYGNAYQPVRDAEGYTAGECCTAAGPLQPPLDKLAADIYDGRNGKVDGVLAPLDLQSSQDSETSDSSYQGRVAPQPSRKQPKRGCAGPSGSA